MREGRAMELIKRLRQSARLKAGRLLAAALHRQAPNPPLAAADLRRVMVVRMNGRMGNTLFLTPLVAGIARALPEASIDLVVLYPEAAELLRGLPGLRRVVVLPHKGWWRLHRSLATLREIRREHYDLAIDPVPDSFGGRLMLSFCRARWRLGFRGENQWAALTHAVDQPRDTIHEALRPLALLESLPGLHAPRADARLELALDSQELQAGAARMRQCLAAAAIDGAAGQQLVGFFAYARGHKSLGVAWWQQFWAHFLSLDPGITPIEVLPSATTAPVLPGRPALHERSVRQLAAVQSAMHHFISADTGPLHLAGAAGIPVIALFGPTTPDRFGPLKPTDAVLTLDGRTPEEVADACRRILREGAAASAAS